MKPSRFPSVHGLKAMPGLGLSLIALGASSMVSRAVSLHCSVTVVEFPSKPGGISISVHPSAAGPRGCLPRLELGE